MSAVIRKHEASEAELHATIEIHLLEVFQILACSQLNRQRLIPLGILPALARMMKVCLAGLPMCAKYMPSVLFSVYARTFILCFNLTGQTVQTP